MESMRSVGGFFLRVTPSLRRIERIDGRIDVLQHRSKEERIVGNYLVLVLVACLAVGGLSGCKKEEGPAEKLGKEVDKAVTEAGDKLKEATKQK
jgi:hypothetical protein